MHPQNQLPPPHCSITTILLISASSASLSSSHNRRRPPPLCNLPLHHHKSHFNHSSPLSQYHHLQRAVNHMFNCVTQFASHVKNNANNDVNANIRSNRQTNSRIGRRRQKHLKPSEEGKHLFSARLPLSLSLSLSPHKTVTRVLIEVGKHAPDDPSTINDADLTLYTKKCKTRRKRTMPPTVISTQESELMVTGAIGS